MPIIATYINQDFNEYMGYTYYSNASANSISGDSAKTVSVGGSRRRKKRCQNKNKKSKRS